MGYKILAINPGSTSTKVAVYDDEQLLLKLPMQHSAEELARFTHLTDQHAWRRELILGALAGEGFDIRSLSAVIGRGGFIHPVEGGVYEVNERMTHDLLHATRQHASNLGALIADEIARSIGVKAYIADPVVIDEMEEVSRISGLPELPRLSIFHALNQKATARLHARRAGRRYEELNLIVAHLGGGITIGAHRRGRVIDVNNAFNGDGPFSPERAGTLATGGLVDLCYSGRYSQAEMHKLLSSRSGLMGHLGTQSVIEAMERVAQGDKHAELVMRAMCYAISKEIGAMAVALEGEVDAILLTGGIAHNRTLTDDIARRCRFLAPVEVYPGENELEALAMNALRVLRGEVRPGLYA